MDFDVSRDYWVVELPDPNAPYYEDDPDSAATSSGTITNFGLVAYSSRENAEEFIAERCQHVAGCKPKKLTGKEVWSYIRPPSGSRGRLFVDGEPCNLLG